MAVDFPSGPTPGQLYSVDARTWVWTGSAWRAVSAAYGPSDPVITSILYR